MGGPSWGFAIPLAAIPVATFITWIKRTGRSR